jgi:WD40 domain-containing protein
MNVKRLLERVPADHEAEERAWTVVRAAYAEREHVRVRPRRRLMLAGVALAVVVTAAAFSSPGRAVVNAVRRTIGISHAAPALFRLPADGRLLVSGGGGAWVVAPDGSKRRLGSYREAAWSPHGLYVITATSNELAAVEPATGIVHWSLARPDVAFPRWGGSRTDTRVAYLSRGELRVVAGDGTGDAAVGAAARVAPAWRPGNRRQLVYVTRDGHVRLLGVWRSSQRYADPRSLVWSPDGKALVLVTARQLVLFAPASGRARTLQLRDVSAAAFSRQGELAIVRRHAILVLDGEQTRPVFTARVELQGLVWSPDGRWLLTSLPSADQWIFVGKRRVLAVSHIARQFGGAASLDGWVAGPYPG